MSVLKYLMEYSKDYMPPSIAWRERRVWHKTKSGKMNFVKIKSLAPEEQLKYKPLDLVNRGKKSKKLNTQIKIKSDSLKLLPTGTKQTDIQGEVFNFYYGVKDISKYKDFEKDNLVVATLDPSVAVDMEEEGLNIVFAINVPVDAVKEYMDEDGNWRKIEIDDKNKKAEFIKFSENDYFKVDFFTYKDVINFELQSDESNDSNNENDNDNDNNENENGDENNNESNIESNVNESNVFLKKYTKYIIEKQITFLMDNNMIKLIKEDERIDPKYIEYAKRIADKLKIKFDGFLDLGELSDNPLFKKFYNMAHYTDPVTKSSLTVNIFDDFVNSLKNAWEKLKQLRLSYKLSEPESLEF